MTYEEWIERVRKILNQYDEGAIFASEAFTAILASSDAVAYVEVVKEDE